MLDTKFILANLDLVRKATDDKHAASPYIDFKRFAELDEQRRKAQAENDKLAAEKNKISKQIGQLIGQMKRASDADRLKLQSDSGKLQEESKALDEKMQSLAMTFADCERWQDEMRAWIPNVPHESVPEGTDPSANKVVREWGGEPRKFEFKPRYHHELGADLRILDCERGAKVAGSGWYFLRGDGARLERALVSWFLDVHRTRHGYTELFPPFFVTEKTLYGSGQLPKFLDQMYNALEDHLFAIPTAEVPVTAYHRDEVLEEKDLPKKFCAYSACFRREAGAAGADTRGILRVHQFNKVEMLKLATPQTSWDEHEKMTADAEHLLQELGLKYRVISLCRGDLGFSAAKTYDLEVWAPAAAKWLEVSSVSNFTDYQARRSNLRYKPAAGGKPQFLHTLNGSGLALPRIQVALWETYQQADGSVAIPEVIRSYMCGQERIGVNA
ncbi:MAG: serine--tRNA ligase [Planctomycetes bacterium]|nr:serine--tRNA ligase [Planctomycetota bacterium]